MSNHIHLLGSESTSRLMSATLNTVLVLGALFIGGMVMLWPTWAVVNAQEHSASTTDAHPPVAMEKVRLSDDRWRRLLTPEQFEILRRAGTEPAFQNRYFDFKGKGTYACVACGNRLFSSTAKFDSGTGWPSFTRPLDDLVVAERPDNSHGMKRIEIVCTRCGGHLGHVFDDGPKPTGLRYCMNSAALTFFADKHAEHSEHDEHHE